MKITFTLLLVPFVVSCTEDDKRVCTTIRAISGYVSSPDNVDVIYDREYIFFYDGSTLVKKDEYSFDPRSLITNTKYSYDTKGRLDKNCNVHHQQF